MKINFAMCFPAFCLLINISGSHAQNYPQAKNSGQGIVILAGNPLPAASFYRLERTAAANDNYQDIAIIASPLSMKQFRGLTKNNLRFFYPFSFDTLIYYSAWDDLKKSISRFSPGNFMMHPAMQIAAGMAFMDTSARANMTYRYRVSVVTGDDKKIVGITDAITFPSTGTGKPLPVREKHVFDKKNYIEWYSVSNENISWFEVYRRQVLKTDFQKINPEIGFFNKKDTLVLLVSDTLVRNEDNYEYYIIPVDFWGNPGQASEIARTATTADQILPVILTFTTRGLEKQKAIQLKWLVQKYPYMRSISILRSENYDSKFEKIADVPSADTVYIDRQVEPVKTYYYQLVINTMNKKTCPSARVAGMMKPADMPAPAVGLHAENVKTGILLQWKTLDKQLFGCIVYRCNGYKGKMVQVSDLLKVPEDLNFNWLDSSMILNGKTVYSYSVKTISKGNIESRFSDTVSILPSLPVEAPIAPLHLRTRVIEKSIYISWDDMYHLDPYIAGYNIFSRHGKNKWQQLNKELIKQNDNLYIDTTSPAGVIIEYAVESVDVFSNKSPMSLPAAAVIETIKPPAPSGLVVYKTDEGILLKWDGVLLDGLAGYKVYRTNDLNKTELIYTSKPDETSFLDKNVKKEVLWFYYITAVTKNGVESDAGSSVSIRR